MSINQVMQNQKPTTIISWINKRIKGRKLFLITLIGMATSIVFIFTYASGFWLNLGFNIGDGIILILALNVPLKISVPAAIIGSIIADAISVPVFIPATIVIKTLMVLIIIKEKTTNGEIFKNIKVAKYWPLVAIILAEIIMFAGYFLYTWILFSLGTAVYGMLWNAIQAASGIIIGWIGFFLVIGYEKRMNN